MTTKTSVWAVLAAVILLTGCKEAPSVDIQKEYSVMTVTIKAVTVIDKYPATIKGRQDVDIFPQISGRITSVCVNEGQHVSEGQTLFVLDQVPYLAALKTAKANESAAKAAVETARLNYQGKSELHAQNVSSLFEVQKAENALHSAEAALEQAQAQVMDAQNNLSYTKVTSPCSGVISTLPYRVGALVSANISQPLTTVSDNSEMYVYFSIPENTIIRWIRKYGTAEAAIKSMTDICLYLNDGSTYESAGRIESISGVLDSQTGSLSLRAVFPNPKGLLHSGGAGNIGIKTESANKIVIPQSATYELQDKLYVYRLINGKAVSTRIAAKPVEAEKIYIVSSGLEVGQTIITEGVSMLRDGMEIQPKKGGK
ncbi:MAG: efflux RND transporter periplasmic adaptor subunit [Muribaculaceae bacterium]